MRTRCGIERSATGVDEKKEEKCVSKTSKVDYAI